MTRRCRLQSCCGSKNFCSWHLPLYKLLLYICFPLVSACCCINALLCTSSNQYFPPSLLCASLGTATALSQGRTFKNFCRRSRKSSSPLQQTFSSHIQHGCFILLFIYSLFFVWYINHVIVRCVQVLFFKHSAPPTLARNQVSFAMVATAWNHISSY